MTAHHEGRFDEDKTNFKFSHEGFSVCQILFMQGCLVGTRVAWRRAYAAWETTAGLLVGVRLMRVAVGGGVVVVALRGWRAPSVLSLNVAHEAPPC